LGEGTIEKRVLKKKDLDKKKIIRVAVIAVCIVVFIYLLVLIINLIKRPTETFVVENGKIYKEEFSEGYIIRDESIIDIPEHENGIASIKSEAQKVAKGEAVYRYCTENEKEINKKIEELDLKIQETLNEEQSYYSADIKLINSEIDGKLDNLHESNNLQEIQQQKNEINMYLTKKIKIRAQDSNNAELKSLITEREAYEKQLTNNSEYILAEKSGIISYRIDGLEDSLKMEDFSYLSKDFLEGLNTQTSQIIATNLDRGKIVNNFKCNIACILKSEEAKNAQIGKFVKLRLQDSEEISAKIVYKEQQSDDEILLVFEITDSVENLVIYRKISFDVIWWSDSGLKIPNSAIAYEGDFAYVIRNRAGLKEKIIVKVLRSNDKYSIVENYSYAELKEAGYDITTLSSKKSISAYDQIEN